MPSSPAQPKGWTLRSKDVRLFVTRTAGQMGPVTFRCGKKRISPFFVAPFWKEKTDPALPALLKLLRGDFFCLPFGGNRLPYRGERHPLHGETANSPWQLVSRVSDDGCHMLTLRMKLRARPGTVTKRILLNDGESVVYQEHLVSGMQGPNCPGHHPNLEFRSTGNISVSPFLCGSTCPNYADLPSDFGYPGLKAGVPFRKLGKLPMIYGGESDISVYPSRLGHVDVLQLAADPKLEVAWNTVAFPEEGWLYFALRDPRVLRQTVMWFMNAGRWDAPWHGRPRNVMGFEDVTGFFAEGLPASARPNLWTRRGIPTALQFSRRRPTVIRYILGVAPIPRGFQRVRRVTFERNQVVFHDRRHVATAKVDWLFVKPPRSRR